MHKRPLLVHGWRLVRMTVGNHGRVLRFEKRLGERDAFAILVTGRTCPPDRAFMAWAAAVLPSRGLPHATGSLREAGTASPR
jgi:hypothetical protein